jgi:hypothetical protein
MQKLLALLTSGLVVSCVVGACGGSGSGGSTATGGTGAAGATGGTGGATGGAGGSGGATGGASGSGGATGGASGSGGSAGGSGGGASFACGALATCQPGEYCEKFLGGACGGSPPDDAGTCPPNCNKTTCGSSEEVCLCTGYSCKPLPTGCTGCSCPSLGCDCTEDGKGGVFVTCAAP